MGDKLKEIDSKLSSTKQAREEHRELKQQKKEVSALVETLKIDTHLQSYYFSATLDSEFKCKKAGCSGYAYFRDFIRQFRHENRETYFGLYVTDKNFISYCADAYYEKKTTGKQSGRVKYLLGPISKMDDFDDVYEVQLSDKGDIGSVYVYVERNGISIPVIEELERRESKNPFVMFDGSPDVDADIGLSEWNANWEKKENLRASLLEHDLARRSKLFMQYTTNELTKNTLEYTLSQWPIPLNGAKSIPDKISSALHRAIITYKSDKQREELITGVITPTQLGESAREVVEAPGAVIAELKEVAKEVFGSLAPEYMIALDTDLSSRLEKVFEARYKEGKKVGEDEGEATLAARVAKHVYACVKMIPEGTHSSIPSKLNDLFILDDKKVVDINLDGVAALIKSLDYAYKKVDELDSVLSGEDLENLLADSELERRLEAHFREALIKGMYAEELAAYEKDLKKIDYVEGYGFGPANSIMGLIFRSENEAVKDGSIIDRRQVVGLIEALNKLIKSLEERQKKGKKAAKKVKSEKD
jgi:hypothetical protein